MSAGKSHTILQCSEANKHVPSWRASRGNRPSGISDAARDLRKIPEFAALRVPVLLFNQGATSRSGTTRRRESRPVTVTSPKIDGCGELVTKLLPVRADRHTARLQWRTRWLRSAKPPHTLVRSITPNGNPTKNREN